MADEWLAWRCRVDEVEAAFRATHGGADGLEADEEWQMLLDQQPSADEESDCPVCGGTGVALTTRDALRPAPVA